MVTMYYSESNVYSKLKIIHVIWLPTQNFTLLLSWIYFFDINKWITVMRHVNCICYQRIYKSYNAVVRAEKQSLNPEFHWMWRHCLNFVDSLSQGQVCDDKRCWKARKSRYFKTKSTMWCSNIILSIYEAGLNFSYEHKTHTWKLFRLFNTH